MTENMNRIVIRGTPRIVSMKKMQNAFTTGRLDLRPRANSTPIGKERTIPPIASRKVMINPPHEVVLTADRKSLVSNPASRIKIGTGVSNQRINITLGFNVLRPPIILPASKTRILTPKNKRIEREKAGWSTGKIAIKPMTPAEIKLTDLTKPPHFPQLIPSSRMKISNPRPTRQS
jgi:hypothetical protein